MATAKHRALDLLRRERTARTFAPELGRLLETEWTLAPMVDELFGAHAIKDHELRMMFSCSPVVALSRAIALGQQYGPERGLEAIRAIDDPARLADYPFYFAALGEFELRRGSHEIAREHFRAAHVRARNPMERQFLERRVSACKAGT
jgi:predicted RNA polymerase sigma factor